MHWVILDATWDDGTYVVLKKVDLTLATQEIEMAKLLSSPELAEDPKNHCVPILNIIKVDGSNTAFIVMLLSFFTGFAPFETISEDEIVRLKQPPWGGDRMVPEHLIPNAPPCDPFLMDVCCIGNIVQESFVKGSKDRKPKQGFESMRGLISDMTNKDPTQQPTMDEVMDCFEKLVEELDKWTLRSPVVNSDDRLSIIGALYHWAKQLIYTVRDFPTNPQASRLQL
ncbi:hypothetical protein H0H87_002430 [Tephrocybe sp. NHM501043]|nr:hypothetical protein H0H87_002430 [Tephrocybe sp. NHM501043]